jgi:hypothetical protein
MVSDDVDVIESKANKADIESAINTWLTGTGSGATSLDHVVPVVEKRDRVMLAMIHTD